MFNTESQAASFIRARIAKGTVVHADDRRVSNGDQVSRIAALALKRGKSVDLTGYRQLHVVE